MWRCDELFALETRAASGDGATVRQQRGLLDACRALLLKHGSAGLVREVLAAVERDVDRAGWVRRRLAHARLELLLSAHCRKINEGNNGIILKLHMREISSRLVERVCVSWPELSAYRDRPVAVKLRKADSRHALAREYTMHVKAWETIAGLPSLEGLAEIPRPIGFRTLEAKAVRTMDALVAAGYLSPGALQFALREGRPVPVSCFFMELVVDADGGDGKDLGTTSSRGCSTSMGTRATTLRASTAPDSAR